MRTHGSQPGGARVQENTKILKLLSLSQPERDQPGRIDWQVPALCNYRRVIFRGANHTFDSFTTDEEHLKEQRIGVGDDTFT